MTATLKADVALDAPPAPLRVRSFGLTDRGRVRPSNEDHFAVIELARTLWVRQSSLPQEPAHHGRDRGHVLLVADGMGGHRAGQVASALTVEAVEAFALHLLRKFSDLQAADEPAVLADFREALRRADARLFAEVAHHPELKGMGTTLTLAFASGQTLFLFHAGDSRAYVFCEGVITRLTADHTVAAELARQGVLRPEEVPRSPYRHVVTNVLGGGEAGVQVEVHKVALQAGDVLLLCSDGLTDMLGDDRLLEVLAAEAGPEAACRRLVAEANEAGGRDNITAVVARFDGE
jgi:protein phosphatase